jgi:hypothetical protein
LRVRQHGQVPAVGVEQLEAEQPHRHILDRLVDAVLAAPQHDLAEWPQLAGGGVVGDDLALEDRLGRPEPGRQQLDDVGELVGYFLKPPGEQLDTSVGGAVRLNPDTVVLVLGGAPPAQPGQDLRGVGQPLGQHDPHRVARLHPQLFHRGQPAARQRGGDLAEVAADVVAALQHRPGGLAARVHLGKRVQDGGRADAEPQVPGDQAQQVAGLQRGGPGEQSGQQFQFAALRARSLGGGDRAQRAHDPGDLKAGGPRAGSVNGLFKQPLGGLTKVADLPHQRGHPRGVGAAGGGQRAHRELLRQAEVHPGELRRDQPLAQIADGRQQLSRGPRQQRGQPLGQRQPAADLLQVTIGLGHDQVPHKSPLSHPIMTRVGRSLGLPRTAQCQ